MNSCRWMLLSTAVLLSACRGGLDKLPAPAPEPWRIAQVGHGQEARFIRCPVMTCPTVTPKHLGGVPTAARWAQVAFAFGSATLDGTARAVLDGLALKEGQHLQLDGYTDKLGPPALNLALSRQRAEAVRDYVLRETSPGALTVVVNGRGACCFVDSNDTPQGRTKNRRVEIHITDRSPE